MPFPAGGPTDGMARIISERLGTVLGQSIVIENRGGGAGGSVGAKFVAASDPDGYTILITPGGSLTTGPAVHKNIGYDPVKAFAPVAELIETPLVISVNPSLPVKSMAELVSYAKANPGKISWGSQGFGVAPHLLLEMFKLEAGLNIVHVPYRGTAPMLSAMLSGEIQMVIDPITTVRKSCAYRDPAKCGRSLSSDQRAQSRSCRTCRPRRKQAIRRLRTHRSGLAWWCRPERRQPIIDKLNAAFRESMKPPETRALLAKLGADIKIGTPDEFGKLMADELTLWSGVVAGRRHQGRADAVGPGHLRRPR